MNENEILFAISVEDLQSEAIEKIGRRLNDDELLVAKKGLESGLMFDINTIYQTIFFEMIIP